MAPGISSLVVAVGCGDTGTGAVTGPLGAPPPWFRQRMARRRRRTVARGVMIAFLPHQAWISADAIVRAWYRSNISRRQMLEWQTARGGGGSRAPSRQHDAKPNAAVSGASVFLDVALLAKGTVRSLRLDSWRCGHCHRWY